MKKKQKLHELIDEEIEKNNMGKVDFKLKDSVVSEFSISKDIF